MATGKDETSAATVTATAATEGREGRRQEEIEGRGGRHEQPLCVATADRVELE